MNKDVQVISKISSE